MIMKSGVLDVWGCVFGGVSDFLIPVVAEFNHCSNIHYSTRLNLHRDSDLFEFLGHNRQLGTLPSSSSSAAAADLSINIPLYA